jgi:DMSO/TMAO reductase YedYZ molybdopterin-dependent catalytic subunit
LRKEFGDQMSEKRERGKASQLLTSPIRQPTGPAGTPPRAERVTHVGRRTVLGLAGLGAVGIAFGSELQSAAGGALTHVSNALGGLGALVPGADEFRIYTVTGSIPTISPARYRLHVSGLVDRAVTLSLEDLRGMPRTRLVHYFQCVTGWRVPDVHWEGVRLSVVLDHAGVRIGAAALRMFSGDGVYTESLTLDQAHLSDVIVADRMIGSDVTPDHGGPVRLYVPPMYGYKSIKWLDRIEVVDRVVPGYWENYGYPVNGWIGGAA